MIGAFRAWIPAILWAAAIFVLSSRPTLPVDLVSGRDKIAHFVVYAVLGLLLAHGRGRTGGGLWVAVGIGLVYAASDEIHQHFVPGRAAELADWIADALGVIAGTLLYQRRRTVLPRGEARSGDDFSEILRT